MRTLALADRQPGLTSSEQALRPRRQRILQVFEPHHGGVPSHVEHLANGLTARGWQVTVAGTPCAALRRLEANGVEVRPLALAHRPHTSDVRAIRLLVALCQEGPTIVHGHSTKAGLLAAAVARRAGVPSVFTPHAWLVETARSISTGTMFATYDRLLARSHSALIAVADTDREQAVRHRIAPESRIHVIPNGIPAGGTRSCRAVARRWLGLPADGTLACWVGRDARQKRPQDLPGLAALLAGRGVSLVVLGKGLPGTRTARAIEASSGIVLERDIDPNCLYAASDVFVSTSGWEGHPLAVLEAMRAGLPVVAYGVGGLRSQVVDGETGYLVPPGRLEPLAGRVAELADDDVLRSRMGAAAGIRFEREFTAERMVEATEAVYAEVSGR